MKIPYINTNLQWSREKRDLLKVIDKVLSTDDWVGGKNIAKFEKNIKFFVGTCYLLTFLLIIYVFKNYIGINLSSFFILMFTISLIYQIKIFSNDNPINCLKAFKINNYSGIFMFVTILLI